MRETLQLNKVSWDQKRRVKKCFEGKRIWKTPGIQVLLFVSACVVIFLTSIFLTGLSILSSVRYCFVEAYPFKNICQMKIFVIVYQKRVYWPSSPYLSVESKNLRIFKIPYLLNSMPFLHSNIQKVLFRGKFHLRHFYILFHLLLGKNST